jgi:hypothetical protein
MCTIAFGSWLWSSACSPQAPTPTASCIPHLISRPRKPTAASARPCPPCLMSSDTRSLSPPIHSVTHTAHSHQCAASPGHRA